MENNKNNYDIRRRRASCFAFIISIYIFFQSVEFVPYVVAQPFFLILSFNLFGFSISAYTASQSIYKETNFKFFIDYLRFLAVIILSAGAIYVTLTAVRVNDPVIFTLMGFGASIYLMSHVDFIKNNALLFFKVNP